MPHTEMHQESFYIWTVDSGNVIESNHEATEDSHL